MSGKKSEKGCGKDKSLGAPSPLPESCLATYREVFLATEFEKGGDEASVDAVKDGLINLFSKVTPTLSVIDDKSITQKKKKSVSPMFLNIHFPKIYVSCSLFFNFLIS